MSGLWSTQFRFGVCWILCHPQPSSPTGTMTEGLFLLIPQGTAWLGRNDHRYQFKDADLIPPPPHQTFWYKDCEQNPIIYLLPAIRGGISPWQSLWVEPCLNSDCNNEVVSLPLLISQWPWRLHDESLTTIPTLHKQEQRSPPFFRDCMGGALSSG